MSIIAVIPARYDSSRLPGKPLAIIHGRPMIRHVYERTAKASRLDRVLVATDDERIAEAVKKFGGECLMTRKDHPSGTDRLAEAGRLLGLNDSDIVVNVQGDEPLVDPAMIHRLIEAMEREGRSPMATLAYQSTSEKDFLNPNIVKVVVDRTGRALYFSRSPIPYRRDAGKTEPVKFLRHLGYYAYRNGFLQTFTRLSPGDLEGMEKLEQLRVMEHGHTIQVALSPAETLGVDTPEDLERLNALPRELFEL